jgi:hypothetical protein
MKSSLRKAVTAVLVLTSAAACGPDQGVIAGDVYLADDAFSELSLGLIPIHLIEPSLRLDSLLVAICFGREELLATDSAARAAAWEQRNSILREYVLQSTVADANARFVIDSVPRGLYRLWADTVVGGENRSWLQVVFVRTRDTTRINLSNSNLDDDPFLCFRKFG